MELREYWRIFKRRAWIPMLLVVVTVLTAGGLALLSKPEYKATATVTAKSQGTSSTSQVLSFPEVATSNTVALAVIKKLNLNETVDHLTQRVKVSSGRSDLYTISITDPDGQQAAGIANAVSQEAAAQYPTLNASVGSTVFDQDVQAARIDFQKRYEDTVKALVTFQRQHPNAAQSGDVNLVAQASSLALQEQAAATAYTDFETQTTNSSVSQLSQATSFGAAVVDQAVAKPDTSARYLKVAYAAALALVIGIGLIFLLEYMDNAVREPEAVEELIGSPVVGIIPRATSRTLRPARGGAA
ncbi:MAG TPA: Wzz/FepE/Etk N-terminal domain-containing protein [Candidatus Dormibacteraeota bacterium]|nr:Wzz/FepE/Etk N-terminal domain-containing protein [Candidatus Dormibacteraeota bacterium]